MNDYLFALVLKENHKTRASSGSAIVTSAAHVGSSVLNFLANAVQTRIPSCAWSTPSLSAPHQYFARGTNRLCTGQYDVIMTMMCLPSHSQFHDETEKNVGGNMWQKFCILSLCIAIIGGPVTARGEVATAGGDVTTERELACRCSKGAPNCTPKGQVECVPAANGTAFYGSCQWKDGRCQLKVLQERSCYQKECNPDSCKNHSVEVESAVKCNTVARREEDCKATKTKKLSWPCEAGGPIRARAGYKIITNTCEGTVPDSNQPKDQACPEGGCLVQKLEGDCAVDNGECKPVGDPVEEKCRAVPIIRIQVGEPPQNNGNFACQEGSLCPDGSKMQPHPSDPNSACCEAEGSLVCCARLIS